jgi:SAM domain (Sterile alpha motif)
VVRLRSLGLGKYEAAFRENEIDETVLPDLTAEDLKELGVTALGHRRKLLAAISNSELAGALFIWRCQLVPRSAPSHQCQIVPGSIRSPAR